MDLAEDTKSLDRITEDLEMIRRMIRESRDFLLFLKSPVIKADRKKAILKDLLGSRVHSTTQAFLELLAEKGREEILDQITEQFFLLRDEKLGIVSIEIRAATELDDHLRTLLEERFQNLTKKKVRTVVHVDRQLKGGFLARLGDTVYDGSVKHQLELLRARFEEGVGHN